MKGSTTGFPEAVKLVFIETKPEAFPNSDKIKQDRVVSASVKKEDDSEFAYSNQAAVLRICGVVDIADKANYKLAYFKEDTKEWK